MGEHISDVDLGYFRAPPNVQNHILFEICSEIGRQLGGVYSVLKSKAPVTTRDYGTDYTLIGPLDRKSTGADVDEMVPPTPELNAAVKAMKARGIDVVYGRWLIDGAPRVLLLDVDACNGKLEEWRKDFHDISGIDIPDNDKMSHDTLLFGYVVAMFLEEFMRHEKERAVIAQFHEWRSSLGIILLKNRDVQIATIFTAHATVLGRYLCQTRDDFYSTLETFDVSVAEGMENYHRHCIEQQSAQQCHAFSTISKITAYECERLLGRKPDGILPNGLNVARFTGSDESRHHARYNSKVKIRDFVRGHFYGQLDSFNPETTLYFFMAGRYEFKNKGVDLFIESLARLNERLKMRSKNSPTVVAILIMPTETTSITTETLSSQAIVKSLRETVTSIEHSVGRRLFERALNWRDGVQLPSHTELITEQEHNALRKRLHGIQRSVCPPLVTHNLVHHDKDPIINHFMRSGLVNEPTDKVRVVYFPEFLRSSNPVLPIDYDDFVRGTHLGIFPSFYEPWGCTPAECTALGIPSITTDVSGFGSYISQLLDDNSGPDNGIFIVNRRNTTFEQAVEQTADYMLSFCQMGDWERSTQRKRTEHLGELLDWSRMNSQYGKVRRLALRRAYPEQFKVYGEDDDAMTELTPGVWQQIGRMQLHSAGSYVGSVYMDDT